MIKWQIYICIGVKHRFIWKTITNMDLIKNMDKNQNILVCHVQLGKFVIFEIILKKSHNSISFFSTIKWKDMDYGVSPQLI